MAASQTRWWIAGATTLLLLAADRARAEKATYHYVPVTNAPSVSRYPPALVTPAAGERISYFGASRCPAPPPPRPTHYLSFLHPCTGAPVTVPVSLPLATPRILYGPSRVTYDYGTYTVEIRFMSDGAVDVTYNRGFLRRY